MAHARQQIKAAIISAVNGLQTTGSNVFTPDDLPLDTSELPALVVTIKRDDNRDDLGDMGGTQYRELTFSIEAKEKNRVNLSEVLDAICLEVELALPLDPTLASMASDLVINSTDFEDDEAEQPVGTAEMEWVLGYQIDPSDPETIL